MTSNTQAITTAARKVAKYLGAHGCAVSHTRALEALAQAFDIKDFMTLRGMLHSRGEKAVWPAAMPRLQKGQTVTIYTEVVPTREHQEIPPCARFVVDQPFLEQLVRRMHQVQQERLYTLTEYSDRVEWAASWGVPPGDDKLMVFETVFHWQAFDDQDDAVETRSLRILPPTDGTPIPNLADVLRQALETGKPYAAVHVNEADALAWFDEDLEEDETPVGE